MATYYIDPIDGNDSNDGTSFANRKKLLGALSTVVVAGDVVRVIASPGVQSMTVNVAWVNKSRTVALASAVNADVDTGDAAWTASASVTATTSTDRKEGTGSSSIAIASGFTTGLAAYRAMSSTDFSGYQQISFWIKQTSGTTIVASDISITLCSDAAGVTPVDTLNVPAIPANSIWTPVVINKGSALGSAIQSVAVVVNVDRGAQTFLIDNIVAVKASGNADELHHKMLIGKPNSIGAGGTDTQTWYPIRSIRGATITLDYIYAAVNADAVTSANWVECCNSTETVAGRTFTPLYDEANQNQLPAYLGDAASHITVSGGWNRTDMSTQTGYTFIMLVGTSTASLSFSSRYTDFGKIGFARWTGTLTIDGRYQTFDKVQFVGCSLAPSFTAPGHVFTSCGCGGIASFGVNSFGSSFSGLVESKGSFSTSFGAESVLTAGSVVPQLNLGAGTGKATVGSDVYGGHNLENVQYVNNQLIDGAGTGGDPWGPA